MGWVIAERRDRRHNGQATIRYGDSVYGLALANPYKHYHMRDGPSSSDILFCLVFVACTRGDAGPKLKATDVGLVWRGYVSTCKRECRLGE